MEVEGTKPRRCLRKIWWDGLKEDMKICSLPGRMQSLGEKREEKLRRHPGSPVRLLLNQCVHVCISAVKDDILQQCKYRGE